MDASFTSLKKFLWNSSNELTAIRWARNCSAAVNAFVSEKEEKTKQITNSPITTMVIGICPKTNLRCGLGTKNWSNDCLLPIVYQNKKTYTFFSSWFGKTRTKPLIFSSREIISKLKYRLVLHIFTIVWDIEINVNQLFCSNL